MKNFNVVIYRELGIFKDRIRQIINEDEVKMQLWYGVNAYFTTINAAIAKNLENSIDN